MVLRILFLNLRQLCLNPYNDMSGDNFNATILYTIVDTLPLPYGTAVCLFKRIPCRPRRDVDRYSSTHNRSGTRRLQWSSPRPDRCGPHKELRHPFYRRLSGPPARSAWVCKTSPLPDLEPRTPEQQSVAMPTMLSLSSYNSTRECLGFPYLNKYFT